ncbi:hypothetical protein BPP43_07510 [Brachyspira pilosicoli P43/6/78]|uniref:Uncharacterized protein n=2 Tax=Brachyspira pilosicoli TaxID=52584 RepID=A0A3B6VLS9_BRAPL|nr:hypothetical protein BPP43_07510 [Brachyspira pilosicoli P43/6/78]
MIFFNYFLLISILKIDIFKLMRKIFIFLLILTNLAFSNNISNNQYKNIDDYAGIYYGTLIAYSDAAGEVHLQNFKIEISKYGNIISVIPTSLIIGIDTDTDVEVNKSKIIRKSSTQYEVIDNITKYIIPHISSVSASGNIMLNFYDNGNTLEVNGICEGSVSFNIEAFDKTIIEANKSTKVNIHGTFYITEKLSD